MLSLGRVVGVAAIVAPALHSASDALEWYQGGFSQAQLAINFAAFLPMPWLLLGVHAAQARRTDAVGLVGALLYGAAFVYFIHTTLVALEARVPTYAALWQQLGGEYTAWGAVMVIGGLAFTWSAWRTPALPKGAVAVFGAGLVVNLALAVVPAPDLWQTVGTLLRNVGLIGMGLHMVRAPASPRGGGTNLELLR
jgi:hypothetical protein